MLFLIIREVILFIRKGLIGIEAFFKFLKFNTSVFFLDFERVFKYNSLCVWRCSSGGESMRLISAVSGVRVPPPPPFFYAFLKFSY